MFGLTLIKTSDLAALKDKARDADIYKRERDEAHTKRIAPLMAANKRRSEEAAAKRAKENA